MPSTTGTIDKVDVHTSDSWPIVASILLTCRLATADAQLEHASISRQHALLCFREDGSAVLMDLDSAHGTFVGSERLAKVQHTGGHCSSTCDCQDG